MHHRGRRDTRELVLAEWTHHLNLLDVFIRNILMGSTGPAATRAARRTGREAELHPELHNQRR
ncbi:hypothetical protein EYF80_061432 [Liparis tanakae]|uniref:Uncharacterized protein n=1 Tax=Liparis tanakae TaxID=230148 RepID=A0A4Z2EHX6_9TELE|nr:hypothetical protein EYF80_061432 [Liparis tanakae]